MKGENIMKLIIVLGIFISVILIVYEVDKKDKELSSRIDQLEGQSLIEVKPLIVGQPLSDLFIAIAKVETNGNPRIGAAGEIGTYQIRECYWIDAGISGDFIQCWSDGYAERVMKAYWRRYCEKELKALNLEILARVHNGGPRGASKDCTKPYWEKVKESLRGLK